MITPWLFIKLVVLVWALGRGPDPRNGSAKGPRETRLMSWANIPM